MTISREPALAVSETGRRVPDFFVVGHPKCGTTALWRMLKAHPQIFMPATKELRYFATDLHSHSDRATAGRPARTLEEYLSLFEAAGPEQRAGEASPLYLMSRLAARQIADVQPAARIIAILREPAAFVRSLHLQWVRSHFETQKDLRAAISLEEQRRRGRRVPRASRWRPQILLYSEHVRYVEQLRRYHSAFAPEQVLVLIYDDFRRDNEATVGRALSFLGVDGTVPINTQEVNQTVRLRSRRLDEVVHAVSVGRNPASRTAKATLKALIPRGSRHRVLSATRRRVVYGEPRPPEESLMIELRRRFKGEVVALSEYLGRDLVSMWGYDSVG